MKKLFNRMTTFWEGLRPAQRVMVGLGAIVVLLFLNSIVPGIGTEEPEEQNGFNERRSGGTRVPKSADDSLVPEPEEESGLLAELPYEGDGFMVQYLTSSKTYMITVTTPPYEESVQKAYAWLSQKGVTAGNSRIVEAFSRFKNE